MKKLITIIAIFMCIIVGVIFYTAAIDIIPCDVKGDSPKVKLEHLDSLKNRSSISNDISIISLDSILKPGDDTKRWSENEYVDVVGYVYDVKWGGPETCECHSKNKEDLDIHIEIVKDLNDASGSKRMIVEINRYMRAKDSTLSYNVVKLLKGKEVEIKGWMFFDEEHKQNAINTSPNGTTIWRATAYEIHPVCYIREIN